MKPYGINRREVDALEWWAGSQSKTGNKTKSKIKKPARRIYKKKARAKLKHELFEEEVNFHNHGYYCECPECEPKNIFNVMTITCGFNDPLELNEITEHPIYGKVIPIKWMGYVAGVWVYKVEVVEEGEISKCFNLCS